MSFNGQRLKVARVFRNLNITELAEKVGVKKQAVSQYESGMIKPKPETEFAFVSVLGFPREFFHTEYRQSKIENTFFRALSTTNSLDKKTQEIKTEMIVGIYNFFCEYLDLPLLELPKIDASDGCNIENIALELRNFWGLGELPIPNMVNLLENKGIIVSAFDVDNEKIDAFTQVHTLCHIAQYCVVVGNDKKSAVRRNFDIAHELGHIILHNHIGNIEELKNDEFRKMENEANEFAGAFLMPKNTFYADLITPTKLESYIQLKKKWRVSISAMLIRAKQLGRITVTEYQTLMKSMSYRKWRTNEPLDDTLQIPKPMLFSKSVEILVENNILTPQQILLELSKYGLPMNAIDVENLLALDKNTLDVCVKTDVIDFKPKISIIKNNLKLSNGGNGNG